MAIDKPAIRGTVTGKMYCELVEGNRTAFVVGMSDMLGMVYLYTAPEHKPRIDAMLNYLQGYENSALTRRFDEYMAKDDTRLTFMAASCYFKALNEWCGFDETRPRSSVNWFSRLFG